MRDVLVKGARRTSHRKMDFPGRKHDEVENEKG
jgi:hypothetical protein